VRFLNSKISELIFLENKLTATSSRQGRIVMGMVQNVHPIIILQKINVSGCNTYIYVHVNWVRSEYI